MNICGAASGPTVYPPPADDIPCCYGSIDGPDQCACWQPVYDTDQQETRGGSMVQARTVPCHDCAYRPDSPEQRDCVPLPGRSRGVFWCHQGMRRIVGWRHPDGRYAPAGAGAYDPPSLAGGAVPLKADGETADLCAGWLSQAAENVDRRALEEADRG